jgi:hypothetical protein
MVSRTIPFLVWTLLLALTSSITAVGQAKFSTLHDVHFDIRYIQGVTEDQAKGTLAFLQTDYDTLRSQLGLDIREKLEVRLYDSPGRYRSEINMGREALSAMYVRGILHVLYSVPASGREKAERYQLARIFLEQAVQKACPAWLREAFAIHHSGIMSDLTPPGSVAVASFSDLVQDLAEASSGADRNDVNYVLGRTMQFFVERYGEQKAFGLFKEFDGMHSTEKVFKKIFGEEYQDIEKAWSKYVAVKPRKGK